MSDCEEDRMESTHPCRAEQLLAFHCAPALAGIKPANLLCCKTDDFSRVRTQFRDLARQLSGTDICIQVLCRCQKRVLILVYRRHKLVAHLDQPDYHTYLKKQGYPVGQGLNTVLQHLARAIQNECGFPHEIGAFLGYPLEDIQGFIRHRGQNYRLCGYWKVYGDPDRAQLLFARYTSCRNGLCRQLARGKHMAQLFVA